MLRCPRTHSGRASVLLGRSVCIVGTVGAHRRRFHGRLRTGRAGGIVRLDARRRVRSASLCGPPRRPGGSRARRAGKAGALMAGAAVRESVTLAGRADRARVARAFVGGLLGSGHPCGDTAVLLVSELFGNSVRHSGSGDPGETVTVAVRTADSTVRVEVTDRGGPGVPELGPAGRDADGGRGLQLVARLAARWGWRRRSGRMVTWFELRQG